MIPLIPKQQEGANHSQSQKFEYNWSWPSAREDPCFGHEERKG